MKLLLDCDGILSDFVGASLRYLQQAHGLKFTPEQVTEHDICKALSLDNITAIWLQHEWRMPGFCLGIEPYPGSKDFVESLKQLGDIVVVTAPMAAARPWMYERLEWLEYHYGLTDVVFTKHKHHVAGDVMIDDNEGNLLTSLAKYKVLFRRPWNQTAGADSTYGEVLQDVMHFSSLVNGVII